MFNEIFLLYRNATMYILNEIIAGELNARQKPLLALHPREEQKYLALTLS